MRDESNDGRLFYEDMEIDPATADCSRMELDRLWGYCCDCGSLCRGEEAIPDADPYAEDINRDSTPVVECKACRRESCKEI